MLEQSRTLTLVAGVAAAPLYDLGSSVESRSVSFENPTGERGAGGRTASALGVGRKGAPFRILEPGETVTLCDLEGPGVIRHVWMTTRQRVETLQGLVVRAWWDGQTHASIESPVGPLFGNLHGRIGEHQSAVHSVNAEAGLNLWLEMPFRESARWTLTNEPVRAQVFYTVDCTIGDDLDSSVGRLHAVYLRQNPTSFGRDYEILPQREGRGSFIGCLLGIRRVQRGWWGEGEFKVYLDGDREFPSICGTGTEDYIGQSWGIQDAAFLYGGCSFRDADSLWTLYRWHLKDPIRWRDDVRITIQQLGDDGDLYERQDDWSSCAFWYEPIPSDPLPGLPAYEERVEDYVGS